VNELGHEMFVKDPLDATPMLGNARVVPAFPVVPAFAANEGEA
jgi:hypothetical protein